MKRVSRRMTVALGATIACAAAFAPATLAADVTDIGFVDQAALSSIPQFTDANRQLAGFKGQLDRQFAARIRAVHDQGTQARIAQEFQNKLATRQRELFGPAVLAGSGRDRIGRFEQESLGDRRQTHRDLRRPRRDRQRRRAAHRAGRPDPAGQHAAAVERGLRGSNANRFGAASQDRERRPFRNSRPTSNSRRRGNSRARKTDADRQQVLKDYQAALADKQKQEIQPLVDQTRSVIGDVAKKKGLLLVIDRSNLIYGGTDITSDVESQLK